MSDPWSFLFIYMQCCRQSHILQLPNWACKIQDLLAQTEIWLSTELHVACAWPCLNIKSKTGQVNIEFWLSTLKLSGLVTAVFVCICLCICNSGKSFTNGHILISILKNTRICFHMLQLEVVLAFQPTTMTVNQYIKIGFLKCNILVSIKRVKK